MNRPKTETIEFSLSKFYLSSAQRINIGVDIIDEESNFYRLFNDDRELFLQDRKISTNDVITTELHKLPLRKLLNRLTADGINTLKWKGFINDDDTEECLNRLKVDIEHRLPVVISTANNEYISIVSDDNLDDVLGDLQTLQPSRIGVIPFYRQRYLVLMHEDNLLDIITAESLTIEGNGKDCINTHIDRINSTRNHQGLPSANFYFPDEVLQQIPAQDQTVFLENPAVGFRGESFRVDLYTVSEEDVAFFKHVANTTRLQLGILHVVLNDDGEWMLQAIEGPSHIDEFITADLTTPEFATDQILNSYFHADLRKNNHNPPCITKTHTQSDIPNQCHSFHRAAQKLSLDSARYGEKGLFFRIQNGGESLELSTRQSTEPRFSCNHIATICDDQEALYRILSNNNLPVPQQQVFRVTSFNADAKKVLKQVKQHYPVYIKPRTAKKTRGMTPNINTDNQCLKAIREASKWDKQIIVQQQFNNTDYSNDCALHRVIMMCGKPVSIIKHLPAYILGDGVNSLRFLIKEYSYQFQDYGLKQYSRITTDPKGETVKILRSQGKSFKDIPSKNEVVKLTQQVGLHHGGRCQNVSIDEVNPDNLSLFSRVGELLGMRWVAIDFSTHDINQSWKNHHCGIIDVTDSIDLSIPELVTESFSENCLKAYFDL